MSLDSIARADRVHSRMPGATAEIGSLSPTQYQARHPSRSIVLPIRGLQYHLREWRTGTGDPVAGKPAEGSPDAARPARLLLMLHGWMDVSASFQFVVDQLQGAWRVVAPDWRGFGPTDASGADGYWFPDYLGDLDAICDALSPDEPVRLVAHSMGGNVAMIYAGVRAARVCGVVNLEGFGLPAQAPETAVSRYAAWLDELKRPVGFSRYADRGAVADRLMKNDPRLPRDKALFLAEHWATPVPDATGASGLADAADATDPIGEAGAGASRGAALVPRADPAHKRTNPVVYRLEEVLACWRAVTAPVLWVTSDDRDAFHQFTRTDDYRQRLTNLAHLDEVAVCHSGHMLHHDQPAEIARLVEDFFGDE